VSAPRPQAGEDRPSVARMYDYLLGGFHNFAADRAAAEQAVAANPDMPLIMRANRAFLRRAVSFLMAEGIDQFLDLGSGMPTAGNVHEVVQAANPEARVLYVDIDPVAVAYGATLLEGNPNASIIQADARNLEEILGRPEVRRLLDLRQPVGVLLVSVLHFIADTGEAQRLVQALRAAVPPGSYVVISHAALDYEEAQQWVNGAVQAYARSTTPITLRTRSEIAEFLEGLELVEPGLVEVPLWRPEGPDDILLDEPRRVNGVAAVARKP
jgi:hypothetical protein